MTTSMEITSDELEELTGELAWPMVHSWLERGSSVAVYENKAMDSPEFGRLKFVSFGDMESFIEAPTPPQRLPDTSMDMHWAFQLIKICRSPNG